MGLICMALYDFLLDFLPADALEGWQHIVEEMEPGPEKFRARFDKCYEMYG